MLINDFSMNGSGYPLHYRGEAVHLTGSEEEICWSLLKAYPGYLSGDALLLRLGSEAEANVIQSLVCRIRAKIDKVGAPDPIETVWGKGYRWRA